MTRSICSTAPGSCWSIPCDSRSGSARDEDIPALLRELADMLDAHVDGSGQDIMLYYLAARLRERADKPLD